jgi:hypothetical protein
MILEPEKINGILMALLGGRSLVNRWWNNPNKAFDMKTPFNVYIDDPEKVGEYVLDQLESPH